MGHAWDLDEQDWVRLDDAFSVTIVIYSLSFHNVWEFWYA